MSRIRSKGTKPELAVRRHLFSLGYRFRVNVRTLPGHPDIVLPKYRTVIFVNGCFWHAHEGCRYYTHPSTNASFWEAKQQRNRERDAASVQALNALQWNVITLWECELKKNAFQETMEKLDTAIKANGLEWTRRELERRESRAIYRAERKALTERHTAVEKELKDLYGIPASVQKLSKTDE